MTLSSAVLHIDYRHAEVVHFDAENAEAKTIKAHEHPTRQHHSGVRTEHEFYASVCDALESSPEVLVVGTHMAQAGFRHYVEKHRSALAKQIVGWQTVDRPTEGQLLALAREFFIENDNMARLQIRAL